MALSTIRLDGGGATPRLLLARFARIESGWQLADMRAPFWRCYLPLERGGAITLDGIEHQLDPARIMLIPPDTPAAASHRRDFHKAHASLLWKADGRCPRTMIHELPSLAAERRLLRGIRSRRDSQALSLLMLSCFCRAIAGLHADAFVPQTAISPIIAEALRIIRLHPADPPSNASLGRLLGLHSGSLVRRFTTEVGCSPQRWGREWRLAEACRLLVESDEGIEQVAEACGFGDRAHFTRAFSVRWNCPPATFRQRHR